jgi:hypothetical protein
MIIISPNESQAMRDVKVAYVTDDAGRTWEIRPTDGGFTLALLGMSADRVSIRPLVSNMFDIRVIEG